MVLFTLPNLSPIVASLARQNSRIPPARIAIVISIFALALLLGNVSYFSDTVSNVSASAPVAAIQKALQDGHSLVASYAGSAGLYNFGNPSKSAKKRYIVLPATAPNPGFCRTLFALLINDYGAPTIVNWGGTAGSNHYAKITAGHEWLHEDGDEEDIILTIDAHDVWPQLPADVFFQQYEEYPEHAGAIIGAEKHCYPHPEDHPRCMRLPKSPLLKDVYGDLTDKINVTGKYGAHVDIDPDLDDRSSWVWGRYETVRPRYINSGTLIGSRKQLRELYTAGLRKMNRVIEEKVHVTRVGSDQEIFGLVNLDRIEVKGKQLLTPDVHLRLFQVMAHSYKDLYPRPLEELLADLPDAQRRILSKLARGEWKDRQMASNRISNTVPNFIHFAGPKPALEIWWRRMWWMQEEEVDNSHQFFATKGKSSRPVEKFLRHLQSHTDEADGYGIRLANGTWHGFTDLCTEFIPSILADDESNPAEWGA